MSTYKDTDALIEYLEKDPLFPLVERYGITNVIKTFPSADVVEVVRCKECKWHGYLTCSNPDGIKGWVTNNDFCSYGKSEE